MKKTLVYIILFLFLFNSAGYYLIFEVYKYRVKKEMQSLICKGPASLTLLKIANVEKDSGFQRVAKKEIRYKGLLYDVVKEFQCGQTSIFYCIHDEKEEHLLITMKTVNKSKFLFSLWQHVIKIAMPPYNLASTNPLPIKVIFPKNSIMLSSVLLATWSPPPELS